jgi:hypothetical protein
MFCYRPFVRLEAYCDTLAEAVFRGRARVLGWR